MSTTVVAIVSDVHAGSTTAVCPPVVLLDDGGSYIASKAQGWLWENWLAFWKKVDTVRWARGDDCKLLAVFNGDLTEGDHHGSTQIMSGNPTAQAAAVNECMRIPLALNPDALLFVRGTEAHVGKSACFEERIALGLKKDKRPVLMESTGNASHWHAKLSIDGVRLDFSHHGRVGTRPWTRPNATTNLAAEIFYEHCKAGVPYPHLAIRSHMHQYVDTYNQHPVRVIQTPAWQLKTAFIHRIDTSGKLSDIGGLILVIEDGDVTVEAVLYPPDPTPAILMWAA